MSISLHGLPGSESRPDHLCGQRNDGQGRKKYQWIAYHEIMAFVADHFRYRELDREVGDRAYEGPWQIRGRNIDPSCTLRAVRGGTSWDGHAVTWWGAASYDTWGESDQIRKWVLGDDLPKVDDLLRVEKQGDGSCWLNVQGHFNWKQTAPADREWTEVDTPEVWYIWTGYLIRKDEAQVFLHWAEEVDFWGRWMPEAAIVTKMFLGEHAWAPASHYFQHPYHGDDGWVRPRNDCPVRVRTLALKYLREQGCFDCSIDDAYALRVPVGELNNEVGLCWSGTGADFLDVAGQVAAQDPTVHADGPSALLLREDALQEFLARKEYTICWAVLGGKRVLGAGFDQGPSHPEVRVSGAYVLHGESLVGFVNHVLHDPAAASPQLLRVVRTDGITPNEPLDDE